MPDLEKTYLFRMIHIENLPHILQNGITHHTSAKAHPNYKPIGDSSLISTRGSFLLNNGKRLGQYIPFYFSIRTPMLYVIQHGFNMAEPTPAENIVYCVTSLSKIIELNLDFVFTDGHAMDKFSAQFSIKDIENIDQIIDKSAINAKYWKDENDLDVKRRKEAEFLVLGDIAVSAILGFLVYNENAKIKLLDFGVDERSVHIRTDFYF